MPPHPKKKRTSARKGWRWSHLQQPAATITECAQCHSPKVPHTVCPTCGYYGGREIISMAAEEPGEES
ncbi:MAG: 50S ribosomal protein L32 [Chloroflexi bacterium]|nr:50S ribosomal protein L32 [Chloroflexota bacterium]